MFHKYQKNKNNNIVTNIRNNSKLHQRGCPYMEQIWEMKVEHITPSLFYEIIKPLLFKSLRIEFTKTKNKSASERVAIRRRWFASWSKYLSCHQQEWNTWVYCFWGLFALNICKKCESTKEILWFLHLIDFFHYLCHVFANGYAIP